MKVEIKLEDQGIQNALNEMLKRTNDLSPAMRGIAAIMESAAEGAFEDEADPTTGTPWAPLSDETTIPFRMKNGHWPGKKLQVEGGLAASIESASGSDFAEIGASVVYAAIHQFGGTINMPARKKELFFKQNSDGTIGNKFVKKKHSNFSQTANIQAYTIEIPARPFLGLSKQDRQDALDVIRNFLIQP